MQAADPWTIHAASEQAARRGADDVARELGRQLSATPGHLSRVLYFPRHDAKTAHLPLYDVSSRYRDAVGDTVMGSGKYTVALGMMAKPVGGGADAGSDVSYLVDVAEASGGGGGISARVKRRALVPGEDGDVEVQVDASDDAITLDIVGANNPFPLQTTYPIPPSQTALGPISHPYFDYDLTSRPELAQLRWEIHPVEDGPLRYTLTRSPLGDPGQSEPDTNIQAIYHHNGLGVSLSQTYSEGVLLLPLVVDPRSEAIYVASVLGMLWRLRRLDGAGNEGGGQKRRLDAVKKLFKRG
ncbi:hypothetical protein BJY01DRAFT_255848 [Aspergillus pseudoustus]|uniref:Dolichyl-diphosphooligosaccharide--protein glycosyltransferase subunit 1 n=1 Tax=Aspergillus pseudoustus TaxID=1810923 RepID=A0ABR4IJ96_9EURO